MRAVLLLLAGCVAYDESVHVKLRDPAHVQVSVATPDGRMVLDDERIVVPATEPPYLEEAQKGAMVERRGNAIVAMCTWCEWRREQLVVAADGDVWFLGTPERVQRLGDLTRVLVSYIAPLPCHRGGGLCERAAFELAVDTPHDNVEGITFERHVATAHGELFGAKLGIGWGVTFIALGLTMFTAFDIAGVAKGSSAKWAAAGVSTAFVGMGSFFTYIGVKTLRASDSVTQVEPP